MSVTGIRRPMAQSTRSLPTDKDELDLPALDGEEEDETEALPELLDVKEIEGDAFDDATGEDAPVDGSDLSHVEGTSEGGWLVDAENAGNTLDVGPMDVVIEPEGKVLGDDEADTRGGLEDLVSDDETVTVDGGEEGPLDEDEELREEDLPALDADEDGDVSDDELYDRGIITSDEDLKWDDRAWARVSDVGATGPLAALELEPDDSGILAVPGDDPTQNVRDATWKQLDESGRLMAATFVPGGSVVVAVSVPDRSRALIVRIQADGEARIIAEVDPRRADDDGEACTVTFLRWDTTRGCLFVGGNFGVEAYRPAV